MCMHVKTQIHAKTLTPRQLGPQQSLSPHTRSKGTLAYPGLKHTLADIMDGINDTPHVSYLQLYLFTRPDFPIRYSFVLLQIHIPRHWSDIQERQVLTRWNLVPEVCRC